MYSKVTNLHMTFEILIEIVRISTLIDFSTHIDLQERYSHSTYDRLFHQEYGYEKKLHRCDRDHAKSRGLTVNEEVTETHTKTCHLQPLPVN